MQTQDGLTVYELDPQASELWAVAGPAGWNAADIDPDDLPEGFRWVTDDEWERLAIRQAAERDEWSGIDELLATSEAIFGDDWHDAWSYCEDCGRLVCDPSIRDPDEGGWVQVQIGHTPLAADGTPSGLPVTRTCCDACADERAEHAAELRKADDDESWRRARKWN